MEKYLAADDDSPLVPAPFDISEISMPSIATGTVDARNTSSNVGTFYSDEQRRNSVPSRPSLQPRPGKKEEDEFGNVHSKKSVATQLRSLRAKAVRRKKEYAQTVMGMKRLNKKQ